MGLKDELARLLRRPDKSFSESLKFALRAWQSIEFTNNSKYEIVLSWFADYDTGMKDDAIVDDFPQQEIMQLLQLRAHPGLVSQETKKKVINKLVHFSDKNSGRAQFVLLSNLLSFEVLQDVFRADYEIFANLFAILLRRYKKYLLHSKTEVIGSLEAEYFVSVLNQLGDAIKRISDRKYFEKPYNEQILQPLIEVVLILRNRSICFFHELTALEHLLTESYTDEKLLHRFLNQPLHVKLLMLECAIVNRRGVESFQKLIVYHIFEKLVEKKHSPKLTITVAVYALEIFRKHDVGLFFEVDDVLATCFIGQRLFDCVRQFKNAHLREVLMLLCASLRLNPLLLEQHIFQVVIWMMVEPKTSDENQSLYNDFLVLLMNMFRSLSRAEIFLMNLLKVLKEWLKNYTLHTTASRKRGTESEEVSISKRLKMDESVEDDNENEAAEYPSEYLKIVFTNFYNPKKTAEEENNSIMKSFPQLNSSWSSQIIGVAFSKLITSLMSKPSIVIWKTLIHSLKGLLDVIDTATILDENCVFFLDFHSALLCQYYSGSRLVEQTDKFINEINGLRALSSKVLTQFGCFILSHEHNNRTIKAFLECCYHATTFELMLSYYSQDGMKKESVMTDLVARNIHKYLSEAQWTLIQQRVLNFGASSCNYLFNRLLLQRTHAQSLLIDHCNLHTDCLSPKLDIKQLIAHLIISPDIRWFIKQMPRHEKILVVSSILEQPKILKLCIHDLESAELAALTIFEQLSGSVTKKSNSLLASINCDFELMRQEIDPSQADKRLDRMVEVINKHTLKDTPMNDGMPLQLATNAIITLNQLPLAYLQTHKKNLLFILIVSFYRDLVATRSAVSLSNKTFEYLAGFLHNGKHTQIFKFFTADNLIKLLPVSNCWEFYDFLFKNCIKNEYKGSVRFLITLSELLQAAQAENKLNDNYILLLHAVIETLSNMTGPSAKLLSKHNELFLNIYGNLLQEHFMKGLSSEGFVNLKKDKKFVASTLATFATYTNAVVAHQSKAVDAANGGSPIPTKVDEDFRRIYKIYIGHSIDYRNPHAIGLMNAALNHRQKLHLDQDEIEFVLNGYWRQLIDDIKSGEVLSSKSIENAITLIIGNKTNEDLLLTLKNLNISVLAASDSITTGSVKQIDTIINAERLLALIAKCSFSTIKGAIFNDQFKQITTNITLKRHSEIDSHQCNCRDQLILPMLRCHQAIVENKTIPLSNDTLDSIISYLVEISIDKMKVNDNNWKSFNQLHSAISELCAALVKQRPLLLVDRIPQFLYIFKDLMQSIVLYKSERQKDSGISELELDNLAALALKLSTLLSMSATHSIAMKRIAPFLLTFAVNLMVSNKRPTTLYQKIRIHIERICYTLIGICDHRVGHFILRCSNDAARQLYQLLVKDYKKYKFDGKV